MWNARLILTYVDIFCLMMLVLAVLPAALHTQLPSLLVIPCSALLYTLLVFLSCQLVGLHRALQVAVAAVFLFLFLPESHNFLAKDEKAVLELCSQCIVPFFIGQYKRVSQRDFSRIYILMLLMGVFCSYTHDGITIPLCSSFLWLAAVHRDRFFSTGCWPMVIGFVIGTAISVWQAVHNGISTPTHGFQQTTAMAVGLLWDTKIFLLSVGLTAWLTLTRWGRRMLLENYRGQTLLACCALFSFCTLPFAPLGLDNAVTGVCFFCMYWAMILLKALAYKYYYNKKALQYD